MMNINQFLFWFDQNRFYLQQDVCEKINDLKKIMREKLVMEPFSIYVEIPDFNPDPEMG